MTSTIPPSFVEEKFCMKCNDFMPHDIEEQPDGMWLAFCAFCGEISEEA